MSKGGQTFGASQYDLLTLVCKFYGNVLYWSQSIQKLETLFKAAAVSGGGLAFKETLELQGFKFGKLVGRRMKDEIINPVDIQGSHSARDLKEATYEGTYDSRSITSK